MKSKTKNILKYLFFVVIPILSVTLCVVFRLAQGEKTEEIVFGIMLGIVLDLVYLIVLLFMNRKSNNYKNK